MKYKGCEFLRIYSSYLTSRDVKWILGLRSFSICLPYFVSFKWRKKSFSPSRTQKKNWINEITPREIGVESFNLKFKFFFISKFGGSTWFWIWFQANISVNEDVFRSIFPHFTNWMIDYLQIEDYISGGYFDIRQEKVEWFFHRG